MANIVFVDVTGCNTKMARLRGRCRRGERLKAAIPHGHWKTMTFIAGLRSDKLIAPWVIDASPERITIKPGGSTQAVYALARNHCEKFGKKSALKSTTVDGGSYAFDCYVEED